MSKLSFKNLVNKKIREYALEKLNEKKFEHSKMDNLIYTELNIQDYLLSEELSVQQKRNVFHYRTRMAKYSENFKNQNQLNSCIFCKDHIDSQIHSTQCVELMKNIKNKGN